VEVGSVTDVTFAGERVEVTMELKEENRARITSDSRAAIGSVGLLGEAAVDITPSTRGTPIPDWGYIPSGAAAGSIADATAKVTESVEEATALLEQANAQGGSLCVPAAYWAGCR